MNNEINTNRQKIPASNKLYANTVYIRNHGTYVRKDARQYIVRKDKPNQGANNFNPNCPIMQLKSDFINDAVHNRGIII